MRELIISTLAISLASMAQANTVNKELWFDGSKLQINTGADCVYMPETCENTTMGYWYDFDDRKYDKGSSFVLYFYEKDTTALYMMDETIKQLGYASVKYDLNEPIDQTDHYLYNFAGLGFDIMNKDRDSFDITETGGLCVTYTSDHKVSFEVVEEKSNKNFDMSCAYSLPVSRTPNTVDIDISEFQQPLQAKDYDQQLENCSEAFSKAQAILFKINGSARSIEGTLRIFEVGPKGTCTGRDTSDIIEEPIYQFFCKCDGGSNEDCTCEKFNQDEIRNIKANTSKSANLVFVSVKGHRVSMAGIGSNSHYQLLDMQGNVVESGYTSGTIDFTGTRSGNYILKVKGSLAFVRHIILK